jgi:hypothetical protein
MTFTEALYGSQYYEIDQKGRDGNKGRLNGNLLLSVMVMLALFILILACVHFVPDFNETLTRKIRKVFGYSTGKTIGKLLAIPLIAIIYLIVSNTIGNKANFKARVNTFMQYPDEIKKKANAKILVPFFVLLGLMMLLLFTGL